MLLRGPHPIPLHASGEGWGESSVDHADLSPFQPSTSVEREQEGEVTHAKVFL